MSRFQFACPTTVMSTTVYCFAGKGKCVYYATSKNAIVHCTMQDVTCARLNARAEVLAC